MTLLYSTVLPHEDRLLGCRIDADTRAMKGRHTARRLKCKGKIIFPLYKSEYVLEKVKIPNGEEFFMVIWVMPSVGRLRIIRNVIF